MGVVTDVNGDGAAGATVILLGPDSFGRQKVVSQENGFFLLGSLEPGISYQISRRGAENSLLTAIIPSNCCTHDLTCH